MYTIRKLFTFEAAHVLSSCYTKACQRIHGHSYIVEVFVSQEELNRDGMVLDFKKLGEVVKPLLEAWDHRLLVRNEVSNLADLGSQVVVLGWNPTAENMAHDLHQCICECLHYLPSTVRVRVHETATGWAEYTE